MDRLSVVMQWVSIRFVEWYHPALEHGVTHLDVARYSVADYVKQLERDPETAERLGSEARRIHDTLLCPRCLAAFLKETFEAVSNIWANHWYWMMVKEWRSY